MRAMKNPEHSLLLYIKKHLKYDWGKIFNLGVNTLNNLPSN